MKYRAIIDLRIRHAYYADGRCADFAFEPSAATQRLLAGCRCLVQSFPDGFQVSAAIAGDDRLFAALPQDEPLVFHLRLRNADFALFTDLDDLRALPAARFTTEGADVPTAAGGQTPPQVLKLAAVTATRTESLVFPAHVTQAGFVLGGQPLDGTVAGQFRLAGLDAGATVTRGAAARQITVAVAASRAEAGAFTVTYPVAPQLPSGTFARVEITPPPAAGAAPNAYEIRFRPLSAKWRYYLISPPASACAYALDYGQTAAFALSAPDAADPVGQGLLAQYGVSARIDCFTSKAPLPSADAAPAGLRLTRGTEVEALPAPAPRDLCSLGDATPGFFRIVRKT